MSGYISTEQSAILSQIAYMYEDILPGETLGEAAQRLLNINMPKLKHDFNMQGPEIDNLNSADWIKNTAPFLSAIINDKKLSSLYIVAAEAIEDEAASKQMAGVMFSDSETNEAIIAFKGTVTGYEWRDNFQGGGYTGTIDGVSTNSQLAAYEWYKKIQDDGLLKGFEKITVTGHSKGGNLAKYVTIREDSIDECMAFNGQGFSDEFIDAYAEDIAANQWKITNHNTSGDFVSILLNQVGESIYYQPQYQKGNGFGDDHILSSLIRFDGNEFSLVPGVQTEELNSIGEFLSSYLRAIPSEDKVATLNFIGEILYKIQDLKQDPKDILNSYLSENGSEGELRLVASLLSYFLSYCSVNPDMPNAIRYFLINSGMESLLPIVDIVEEILKADVGDVTLSSLAELLANPALNPVLYGVITAKLAQIGITNPIKALSRIRKLIISVSADIDNWNISKTSGEDLKVSLITDQFSINQAASNTIYIQTSKYEYYRQNMAALKKRANHQIKLDSFDGRGYFASEIRDILSIYEMIDEDLSDLINRTQIALRKLKEDFESADRKLYVRYKTGGGFR